MPEQEQSQACMELIWHGTACVEISGPVGRILFDPFVPLEGSELDVRLEDFDGFHDVLVTHGHFDHISSIPSICKRNPHMRVWCTHAPWKTLRGKGVPEQNLRCIDFGDVLELGGMTVTALHGRHAVLPRASLRRLRYMLGSPYRGNLPHIILENSRCREAGETVFYQVEGEGKRICLMGSLNLCDEVTYPTDVDLLVLPYNGWEDNLPPAIRVIERLQPKRVLLDHFDDAFPPITMPLDLKPILKRYPNIVEKGVPDATVRV